ncbi:MAG: hypothetical protein H0T47_10635 [Planctomycetaceae bacterium]|nr:hypothetical protein [Planctomycetaceae bacterium]
MSQTPQTDRMLNAVRRRMYAARWVRLFLWCVFWACLATAAAMPAAWFLDQVDLRMTLAAVPAAIAIGLLVSTLLAKRPDRADAAQAADSYAGTKDLFLTVTRLEASPQPGGDYAPLVLRDAEASAKRVEARRAVPIPFERPLGWAATGLAAALAVAFVVPQFDPFGTVAAAEEVAKEQKVLKALDKANEERKVELRKRNPEAQLSEDVEQSVEQLKQSLKQMKPTKRPENLKVLSDRQKDLGEKWRKASAESLKDLFDSRNSDQAFGNVADGEQLKKWSKELQEGSTESLRKEIDQLKQDLQKLAQTSDPVERQEQLRKVEERLKRMERFAKENANSKPLAASLKRALTQLDAARKAGASKDGEKSMSKEALESMKESLELSKMELQEMAQSARDLKELEKALETLQMAKKAAEKSELDGQECEDCVSLEDYQEYYKELVAQFGEGNGEGMGDRGIGEGGVAPEDDAAKSGFKTEQSKSAVTAGKVLLSLQTKGLSDTGEAEENYAKSIGEVKQGVSEAILQEQVPPGYHEEIKKYFDTLKPAADASASSGDAVEE